jgi:hypothetical protein
MEDEQVGVIIRCATLERPHHLAAGDEKMRRPRGFWRRTGRILGRTLWRVAVIASIIYWVTVLPTVLSHISDLPDHDWDATFDITKVNWHLVPRVALDLATLLVIGAWAAQRWAHRPFAWPERLVVEDDELDYFIIGYLRGVTLKSEPEQCGTGFLMGSYGFEGLVDDRPWKFTAPLSKEQIANQNELRWALRGYVVGERIYRTSPRTVE